MVDIDDDARTIWCGNLSDKVTDDVLYELFLQAGPIQKICIPKDRDGKQRTYGFITYKYMISVQYALKLFEGTTLYNRSLSMKLRNGAEPQQPERPYPNVPHNHNVEQLLQMGQQIFYKNFSPQFNTGLQNFTNTSPYPSSSNDERQFERIHPYHRDKDRNRDVHRNRDTDRNREIDRNKDRERNRERGYTARPYCNQDNSYRSRDYHPPYNNNRKKRKPY